MTHDRHAHLQTAYLRQQLITDINAEIYREECRHAERIGKLKNLIPTRYTETPDELNAIREQLNALI